MTANPTPAQIRAARQSAGLTQAAAATDPNRPDPTGRKTTKLNEATMTH